MKQLLLIFAKSSQPVHQLQNLFSATENCSMDKYVLYDGFIPVKELWENDQYKKYIQLGVDKTEKMMNAFIKAFLKGYDNVILIENTSPYIDEELIYTAFNELRFHEVLYGPVRNGSLYLFGMTRFRPELFEGDISCRTLMENLQKRKISHKELPVLESWVKEKISVG